MFVISLSFGFSRFLRSLMTDYVSTFQKCFVEEMIREEVPSVSHVKTLLIAVY